MFTMLLTSGVAAPALPAHCSAQQPGLEQPHFTSLVMLMRLQLYSYNVVALETQADGPLLG